MVGAIEYQAGEPGSNPTYFSFHFSQGYSKFCSVGRIACVSTHPVTNE